MDKKESSLSRTAGRKTWKEVVLAIITYMLAIAIVFPVYWIFIMSLKSSADSFAIPPKFFFTPTFNNFINVFKNSFFVQNYKNSFIIAFSSTIFSLLLGIPAAYVLTRFKFRGKKTLSFWILVTRMAPASALVVAFFIILNSLNMIDTLSGLMLVYMSFNIGYIIWMVRGFIMAVPVECEEAAIVDGCGRFGAFWHITVPLCIPGIVSVGIQAFIFAWNEFLYALILSRTNWKTAPIAVMSYITSEGIKWGELAAASVLITLPVLILALSIQRYIVSGLTMGVGKD